MAEPLLIPNAYAKVGTNAAVYFVSPYAKTGAQRALAASSLLDASLLARLRSEIDAEGALLFTPMSSPTHGDHLGAAGNRVTRE
jgi:hypothetical protein